MDNNVREKLLIGFTRHSLRLEVLADAIASDGDHKAEGTKLQWEVKQLRSCTKGVHKYTLEPEDLSTVLNTVCETVEALKKHKLPEMVTNQLAAECARLQVLLLKSGLKPR